MEQVKIFYFGDFSTKIEEIINDWLSKNPNIEITNVKQSQGAGHATNLIISIFYRRNK